MLALIIRTGFIMALIFGLWNIPAREQSHPQPFTTDRGRSHPAAAADQKPFTILLERVYLDGEMSEEVIKTKTSLEEALDAYPDWQIADIEEDRLVLQKQLNDISPLLKANGYFGVTKDGVLSIFQGKPQDKDIIHSFFQLNMKKLESRRQQELKNGIPIKTKEDYQKLLKTFKPYSASKKEN
ncbi:BofC C-terminal domain-containing protein [Heyndrickxia acidiproducens]|uniref:BofC C-terminal domain-containing protein n=1 Tax=Heyndrickxia acidiproducens TaxID=1121084 RepID=UPI00037EE4E6|nr:BofC C-terminal domain-containing protein [Heyndrickxia acidiproducens]